MFGAASLVFALGMVAGLMLLRRGWVLTFLGLLLGCLFIIATMLLGIFPSALFGSNMALAGAVILTPWPLGAGLMCGALTAWLLRRANGA
ncbi:MAG: hypothetical protein AAGM84_07175 [Pseudomonadota bacterium]